MRKFEFLKPESLGLNSAYYEVNETSKGYKMDIGDNQWVGFPRSIVENNPDIFMEIIPKKKRDRIKTITEKIDIK